ncbi:MAG: sigma 54-interacting transcriptional regulator [Kofleriaceae bacterium]
MSTLGHRAAADAAPLVRYAIALLTTPQPPIPIDRRLLVGRSADCDVALTGDVSASRAHAQIAVVPGGVEVTDLHSRNGVHLDGRRISGSVIVQRGVLRIGDSVAAIIQCNEHEPNGGANGPLVGGPSLAGCRRIAGLVGATDLAIHITGETGTGKEVLARWLHEISERSGTFSPVNCAALPDHLVESELFGHVRGAFTGATHARRGLISAAAGGTLFLDEVGDLPLGAQAKLLRVLEDHEVRPIGGTTSEQIDFRLISATNVDLVEAVERGRFRSDLAARLCAVELRLPPLRDRIEDLPVLSEHLARRAGYALTLSPDAIEALARYSWPQNVRELAHVLRSAAVIARGPINLGDLPERVRAGFRPTAPVVTPPTITTELTRERLEAALLDARGNVRHVSIALGVARSQLYRWFEKWSLKPATYRAIVGTLRAKASDPS